MFVGSSQRDKHGKIESTFIYLSNKIYYIWANGEAKTKIVQSIRRQCGCCQLYIVLYCMPYGDADVCSLHVDVECCCEVYLITKEIWGYLWRKSP